MRAFDREPSFDDRDARRLHGMTEPLGKISPRTFTDLIAPRLGAARPEVLVGPRAGVDSAIVKLSAGRVMAVTTDPLSIVPAWGFARSARVACNLLASDLWTTGIPPAYASVDFNLPPQMTETEFAEYWQAMSDEWARLEVAVVTGHTGRYPGCDYSIVGACTLIGVGDEGRYLTPSFASPGDRVLVTKGAAIETAAIVGWLCPSRLEEKIGPEGVTRARAMVEQVGVVRDCLVALRVGVRDRGVTALHDATEGGVLGGLLELAQACGADLRVDRAGIPLSDEARGACEVLGIDPWWALSQGTLIAAVKPAYAANVLAAFAEEGLVAADVGEIMTGDGALWLSEGSGPVRKITTPEPDPYWPAYARAVREGWT
jgi:hydrogenase expression/formation protein HypE